MTVTESPPFYDPVWTFVGVFADDLVADHIGGLLTCGEVNVLAGLLESCGQRPAAGRWLSVHRAVCDAPDRH